MQFLVRFFTNALQCEYLIEPFDIVAIIQDDLFLVLGKQLYRYMMFFFLLLLEIFNYGF